MVDKHTILVDDMSKNLGPNSWKGFFPNVPTSWRYVKNIWTSNFQCPSTALHRHDQLAKYHPVPWLRWHNVSWHQVFRLPEGRASTCPEIWSLAMWFLNIKCMKIMEFDLKWVHMPRYELILTLDGALWLTIISKTPLTPITSRANCFCYPQGRTAPSRVSGAMFHEEENTEWDVQKHFKGQAKPRTRCKETLTQADSQRE